ncbi:hypothetical protein JCM10296v2_003120 [Rhodotorula toruloides]
MPNDEPVAALAEENARLRRMLEERDEEYKKDMTEAVVAGVHRAERSRKLKKPIGDEREEDGDEDEYAGSTSIRTFPSSPISCPSDLTALVRSTRFCPPLAALTADACQAAADSIRQSFEPTSTKESGWDGAIKSLKTYWDPLYVFLSPADFAFAFIMRHQLLVETMVAPDSQDKFTSDTFKFLAELQARNQSSGGANWPALRTFGTRMLQVQNDKMRAKTPWPQNRPNPLNEDTLNQVGASLGMMGSTLQGIFVSGMADPTKTALGTATRLACEKNESSIRKAIEEQKEIDRKIAHGKEAAGRVPATLGGKMGWLQVPPKAPQSGFRPPAQPFRLPTTPAQQSFQQFNANAAQSTPPAAPAAQQQQQVAPAIPTGPRNQGPDYSCARALYTNTGKLATSTACRYPRLVPNGAGSVFVDQTHTKPVCFNHQRNICEAGPAGATCSREHVCSLCGGNDHVASRCT